VKRWAREAIDDAGADRVDDTHEHNRDGAGRFVQRPNIRAARGQNDVRRKSDQFRHHAANVVVIAANPAIVDLHVLLVGPAQLLQRLPKGGIASLNFQIGLHSTGKHGDAPHSLRLLRARAKRPGDRSRRRASEHRDEFASSNDGHWGSLPRVPPLIIPARGPPDAGGLPHF
jgi:hypothetical protein